VAFEWNSKEIKATDRNTASKLLRKAKAVHAFVSKLHKSQEGTEYWSTCNHLVADHLLPFTTGQPPANVHMPHIIT
jgi:hypothetical protein